jgi:hypothetical protein
MVGKFCLPDDDALVDICFGGIDRFDDCFDYAELSGHQSRIGQPGEKSAHRLIKEQAVKKADAAGLISSYIYPTLSCIFLHYCLEETLGGNRNKYG